MSGVVLHFDIVSIELIAHCCFTAGKYSLFKVCDVMSFQGMWVWVVHVVVVAFSLQVEILEKGSLNYPCLSPPSPPFF